MYNCSNCNHQIKIRIHKCPFCGFWNFDDSRHAKAKMDFKRGLVLIAIKLARPKTQSITIFKVDNALIRIIALTNDTQIITTISEEKEG